MDENQQSMVMVMDGEGWPRMFGPFDSSDAAYKWANENHKLRRFTVMSRDDGANGEWF